MHRELRRVPRVRARAAAIQEVSAQYLVEQAAAEARFRATFATSRARNTP